MPLSDADILQSNSGGFTGTSGNATLPVGTTANSTLILAVTTQSSTVSTPSGFVLTSPASVGTNRLYVFRRGAAEGLAAGETSWTISTSPSAPVAWQVYELQGIDPDAPVDVSQAAINSPTSVSSVGTGTSPQSTTYDGLVLYCFSAGNTTDTTIPTFSGYTDGTELGDSGQAGTGNAVGLAVAARFVQQLGTFASTATISLTAASANGWVCVLTATGAKRAANLDQLFGFEWGTTAGLATGNVGNRVLEAVTGTPAITTSTPRTGTYCLELSASAAVENVQGLAIPIVVSDPNSAPVLRACFRFVGGLPAGDAEVCALNITGGNAVVRYVSASSKLGLKVGTGTEQLSDATVTADQWIAVDLRVIDTGADWAGDWTVTYDATPGASSAPVAQTRATLTTGTGLGNATPVLGWVTAATATIRYDDVVCSAVKGHYPLGDHQVRVLKPTATLAVTGTASNFALMTSNATGAAFDAATALANISELPPVIGASAAGFCQTAAAAGDYVAVPMETYQAAPSGSIRAVRMLACGWAASATTATIGFRAHDGVTEHTLFAAGDVNFDNATVDPAWVCKPVRTTGGAKIDWTQAKLDALTFRVGRSDDATPDIGIHAIYAEVAVQVAQTQTLFGTLATQKLDPLSAGVLGVTVDTTTTGAAAELYYEESGSPTTVPVDPDVTHTEVIDAPDMPSTNRIELRPDPEPS